MAEFRWILLGLGLALIAGIWWWGARREREAPNRAPLREPPRGNLAANAHTLVPAHTGAPGQAEWGVPPFEPLNIRTADFDPVPELDRPMTAQADPIDVTMDIHEPDFGAATLDALPLGVESAAVQAPVAMQSPVALPPGSPENSDRFAAVTPQVPNVSELQRIVTLRVCSVGGERWSGARLISALELLGLAYGRYQVYHRRHTDGRSLFCVASLVEPGTFDMARMAEQEFRGVTLFAVLPGPLDPLPTVDALMETARALAQELSGMIQDAKGMAYSPQRLAALREDVAHFQALLS